MTEMRVHREVVRVKCRHETKWYRNTYMCRLHAHVHIHTWTRTSACTYADDTCMRYLIIKSRPNTFALCQSGNFIPLNSSFSRAAHLRADASSESQAPSDAYCCANAAASLLPRPTVQVRIKSPTPLLSSNTVSGLAPTLRANAAISLRPRRMTAARVLAPSPSPSQNPAASEMTFLRPPHNSTPRRSLHVDAPKAFVWNKLCWDGGWRAEVREQLEWLCVLNAMAMRGCRFVWLLVQWQDTIPFSRLPLGLQLPYPVEGGLL